MKNNKKNKKDIIIKIILIIIIILLLIHSCSLTKKIKDYNSNTPTGNIDIYEINPDDSKRIKISDNEIVWGIDSNLKIFTNLAYDKKEKIAPESSNTYIFAVKNNTKNKITYSINFNEENNYNINMKYRLKKGNKYVVGNEDSWVSYKELNQNNINLNKKNSDKYYLEWKWISSNNDTEVAGIDDAYKLSIKIEAIGQNE